MKTLDKLEKEVESDLSALGRATRNINRFRKRFAHSPDTENEDSAWSTFFRSKRKKKSIPKLDLVDVDENNNFNYFDDHEESLGSLKQWIDNIDNNNYNNNTNVLLNTYKYMPYNFNHFMELSELGGMSLKYRLNKYTDYLFSNNVCERFQGNSRVFCSDFSADGNVLCVASQDHVTHLIDSHSGSNSLEWPIYKQVESQFSGWSIIDVALSPDHSFVAYSGWSSSIYLVNTFGSHELHESHDLNISTFNSWGRCCVFGVEFDPNSKKVICALSGGCLILHDLERKINQFSLPSAHDDINQATFLDTNIIISGSDNALLRVMRLCVYNNYIYIYIYIYIYMYIGMGFKTKK